MRRALLHCPLLDLLAAGPCAGRFEWWCALASGKRHTEPQWRARPRGPLVLKAAALRTLLQASEWRSG
jgi:hypothetical protein